MLSKYKSFLFQLFLKVGVFLLLLYGLYQQVFKNNDLQEFFSELQAVWQIDSVLLLMLVVLLMLVNWSLETLKWKILISPVEQFSFFKSLKSVLSGLTLTLFTPNRIGQFGGRFLYLKEPLNPNAWWALFTGSYAQILVTLIGGISATYFLLEYLLELTGRDTLVVSLLNTLAAITVFITVFYFNSAWLIRLMNSKLFRYFLKRYREPDIKFDFQMVLQIFILSAFRYTVYCFQFLALLWLFDVPLDLISGIQFLAVIYLIQTILPSLPLFDLAIRGNIALFIFTNQPEINTPGVLSATFLLWLINLVIPGIIGYGFILFRKSILPKV